MFDNNALQKIESLQNKCKEGEQQNFTQYVRYRPTPTPNREDINQHPLFPKFTWVFLSLKVGRWVNQDTNATSLLQLVFIKGGCWVRITTLLVGVGNGLYLTYRVKFCCWGENKKIIFWPAIAVHSTHLMVEIFNSWVLIVGFRYCQSDLQLFLMLELRCVKSLLWAFFIF